MWLSRRAGEVDPAACLVDGRASRRTSQSPLVTGRAACRRARSGRGASSRCARWGAGTSRPSGTAARRGRRPTPSSSRGTAASRSPPSRRHGAEVEPGLRAVLHVGVQRLAVGHPADADDAACRLRRSSPGRPSAPGRRRPTTTPSLTSGFGSPALGYGVVSTSGRVGMWSTTVNLRHRRVVEAQEGDLRASRGSTSTPASCG